MRYCHGHGMAAVEQLAANDGPLLPPEMWGLVARATLRAEDEDVRSLERLSLVNRAWRAGLAGDRDSNVQASFVSFMPACTGVKFARLRACLWDVVYTAPQQQLCSALQERQSQRLLRDH